MFDQMFSELLILIRCLMIADIFSFLQSVLSTLLRQGRNSWGALTKGLHRYEDYVNLWTWLAISSYYCNCYYYLDFVYCL